MGTKWERVETKWEQELRSGARVGTKRRGKRIEEGKNRNKGKTLTRTPKIGKKEQRARMETENRVAERSKERQEWKQSQT